MEQKLQIKFVHRKGNFFDHFFHSSIVQSKVFEFGVQIKNTGNHPLTGATISNIVLRSAEGQNILHKVDDSFHLDTLNPHEEKTLWIRKIGTHAHGLFFISLQIKSDIATDTISTFQVDPFTKMIETCKTNEWLDFFFVRNINEHEQSIANNILLYFAILSTFSGLCALYYTYIQAVPVIISEKNNYQAAQEYCKSNSDASWPKLGSGVVPCKEISGAE
jgi:hypothetical protein